MRVTSDELMPAARDGTCIIRTNVPEEGIGAEDAVLAYKILSP